MNTVAHTAPKSDTQAQTVAEALSRTYQGVSRRCVPVTAQRVRRTHVERRWERFCMPLGAQPILSAGTHACFSFTATRR